MTPKKNNPLLAILAAGVALWLFAGKPNLVGPAPNPDAVINVDDQGTAAQYSRVVTGPEAKADLLFWSAYCAAIADKIEEDGRRQTPRITQRHALHDLLETGNTLHSAGRLSQKYKGFGDIPAEGLRRAIGETAGQLTPADRAKVVEVLRANAAGAAKAGG